MRTLHQIYAIGRTEFRFGLRRGAPVVVTAIVGLVVAAGILLSPFLNLGNWQPVDQTFSPAVISRLAEKGITVQELTDYERDLFADLTVGSTPDGWVLMLLALLLLPVATAMVIPADRQFGALELLRSTPLSGSTYLAGKILGVLSTVFLIGLFPFLLFFAVLEIAFLISMHTSLPAYLIGFYIKLTLMDGLPLCLWGAVTGVLVGVGIQSRRVAMLPGFISGLLSLFFWISAFRFPIPFGSGYDKVAYYVFEHYNSVGDVVGAKIFGELPPMNLGIFAAGTPVVGIGQVLSMYLIILAALAGLAAAARLWLYQKENL